MRSVSLALPTALAFVLAPAASARQPFKLLLCLRSFLSATIRYASDVLIRTLLVVSGFGSEHTHTCKKIADVCGSSANSMMCSTHVNHHHHLLVAPHERLNYHVKCGDTWYRYDTPGWSPIALFVWRARNISSGASKVMESNSAYFRSPASPHLPLSLPLFLHCPFPCPFPEI